MTDEGSSSRTGPPAPASGQGVRDPRSTSPRPTAIPTHPPHHNATVRGQGLGIARPRSKVPGGGGGPGGGRGRRRRTRWWCGRRGTRGPGRPPRPPPHTASAASRRSPASLGGEDGGLAWHPDPNRKSCGGHARGCSVADRCHRATTSPPHYRHNTAPRGVSGESLATFVGDPPIERTPNDSSVEGVGRSAIRMYPMSGRAVRPPAHPRRSLSPPPRRTAGGDEAVVEGAVDAAGGIEVLPHRRPHLRCPRRRAVVPAAPRLRHDGGWGTDGDPGRVEGCGPRRARHSPADLFGRGGAPHSVAAHPPTKQPMPPVHAPEGVSADRPCNTEANLHR